MGYVTAAYLVVLGAMALYWWSLAARRAELRREGAARPRSGEGPSAEGGGR